MRKPRRLPAHLRPLSIDIPRTWTPEQALALFELIDDLRDKVWALYGDRMQALLRDQRGMRRRWRKSRRQRRTITLNRRISRGSIETAIPSSRPERCKAGARSGGQGRPKGAARRREASLMVASTTASWARRDDTATRVNHHENPFTPIDVLRPRLAPNQHIQPVIAEPRPRKALSRRQPSWTQTNRAIYARIFTAANRGRCRHPIARENASPAFT